MYALFLFPYLPHVLPTSFTLLRSPWGYLVRNANQDAARSSLTLSTQSYCLSSNPDLQNPIEVMRQVYWSVVKFWVFLIFIQIFSVYFVLMHLYTGDCYLTASYDSNLTQRLCFVTLKTRFLVIAGRIPQSLLPKTQATSAFLTWCQKSGECARSFAQRSACPCSQSGGGLLT